MPGLLRPVEGTQVERSVERRSAAGAVADMPPFSLQEAQASGRGWVWPLGDDYRRDFLEYASKWPDGVVVRGTIDGMGSQSSDLNPDGLVIPRELRHELVELNERYLAELAAQGEVAFQLASDAMAIYYDSLHGPGWQLASDPKPAAGEIRGRWSRQLTVPHGEFCRPIRFDSADFEFLENQLKLLDQLKVERLEAIRGFIAREGRAPD